MKKKWFIGMLAALCLLWANACAEPLRFILPVDGATVEIWTSEIEGEQWLLLPSFADADSLGLQWQEDGWNEEGVREALWQGETIHVMQSAHMRALFVLSADPVHEGRAYIDGSPDHSTQTTGSIALISQEGKVDHADHLRQLRGRGNGSWGSGKKPYQFKLENRADLLKTGDPDEAARTWVLLAEASDRTFLHNRIALDLALEMGLKETSHSEFVDLYYDGEYRGLYLLAEKVEVDPARVDEMDYEKLIESWNHSAGINDLEALDAGRAENRYGNAYTFIEGVQDNDVVNAGAYLLEMENEAATLSDRCFFYMDDASVIALKNPENASDDMVRFISEKLTHARRVLKNGGISPEGDETIEDVFDVDAFARTALLYELCHSDSGFRYSSTYFVLPAGEDRFRPGPVWDFDLTWDYYRNGVNDRGIGVKELDEGWLPDFYSVPAFSEAMKEIYISQMYPLVRNVLLGDQQGAYLKPLDEYENLIWQARRMDGRLWEKEGFWRFVKSDSTEESMIRLRRFIDERSEWMYHALSAARPDADAVTLCASTAYGYADSHMRLYACPWNHVRVRSCELEPISEATEEDYAVWRMDVEVEPLEGYAFKQPSVTCNGVRLQHEILEDGVLRVAVTFEDPSYRPVDYYGEDIGLVYNPDFYAEKYPDIAAEYEDDPQGLMDYFCDDGMYEDQMGNAFFRPSDILIFNPELMDLFGEDWQLYYWDFLYYGYTDGWLLSGGNAPGFTPVVRDAL